MKIYLTVFIFIYSTFSYSQDKYNFKILFNPTIGFEQNSVNWAISGDILGNSPNYLSELIWVNNGANFSLQSVGSCKSFILNSNITKFYGVSGFVSDIDYQFDNRVGKTYDEKFPSGGSKGFSFALYPGYCILENKLSINLGFKYSVSNNLMNHDENVDPSSYEYITNNMLIGGLYNIPFNEFFEYSFETNFLITDFQAKANWSLRNDLNHPISFRHDGKLLGYTIGNTIRYYFNNIFSVSLRYVFENSWGKNGIDKMFYTSGTVSRTKLQFVSLYQNNVNIGFNVIL